MGLAHLSGHKISADLSDNVNMFITFGPPQIWWLWRVKMLIKFNSEKLKGRVYLGDLDLNRRVTLKRVLEIGFEDVGWSHVVQNSVQRWAVVNTVINI